MRTGFWWRNLRERGNLEDLGVDGKIILKWIFLKWAGEGGMCRIDVAQDKDRWQALVNAVMNFRVHKMRGISRLAESLLASEEGVSM